jgi:predicted ribosome quality control (RQC) complex YloA/Tae2 family protein
VILLFRRRKKQAISPEISELEKKIQQLEETIQKLQKSGSEYHVHIDHIHINQPVVEELSFHLDSLDIEDLSGALNLGNNFGVTVGKKKEAESCSKAKKKHKEPSMNKHETGYSFSFQSSRKEAHDE